MFDPSWDEGCASCTAGTDELSAGFLEHLHIRDTTYAMVSRAPLEPFQMPGRSCFLRVGDRVFHTYSQYARGPEATGGSYYFLDLTALGRQEDWEERQGRSWSVRSATPDFAS
jgi:predicted dithiol-disulfide oxidoreductase (DUF899 family)